MLGVTRIKNANEMLKHIKVVCRKRVLDVDTAPFGVCRKPGLDVKGLFPVPVSDGVAHVAVAAVLLRSRCALMRL